MKKKPIHKLDMRDIMIIHNERVKELRDAGLIGDNQDDLDLSHLRNDSNPIPIKTQ